MLKRRGRSFDSFYPTNAKGLCWQTSTVFTLVNHQAFRAPRFYPFFFFFRSEFLLRVRFDKSSKLPLCSIFVVSQRILFLNVHVSSAKKFSISINFSTRAVLVENLYEWSLWHSKSIESSQRIRIYLYFPIKVNFDKSSTLRITSIFNNLSNIFSISFIHCTCLLIYLHRFSFFFFFYPFQSTNKEKSQRRTSIVSPIDVIIIRYSVSSMKKKKKKEIRSKRVYIYIR